MDSVLGSPNRNDLFVFKSARGSLLFINSNSLPAFKEHLITVRNSPGVPHNPQMMPAKGLLKTPVGTPVKQVKTYQKKGAAPQQPRRGRRSHAADFFNQ